MTGLEKIIAQIADESSKTCSEIMISAKEEAGAIVTQKRLEANKEAERLVEEAKLEAEKTVASAKVSADAFTRTKYLEVRNAVVNDIIAAAYEEIAGYDDEKYFDFLFSLLVRYLEPGQCSMLLSERDLLRLPKDFEVRINSEVYEKAAVSVSDTPGNFELGFVLVYPDFEVNCSIRNLFEENMDLLKDKLCDLLFD